MGHTVQPSSSLLDNRFNSFSGRSRGFKPYLGNPAVRHYRGASGNVTLVEMGTHLATERARLVTLHLTVGAPDFYPSELMAN
jgi:hypothetical protein